MTNKHTISRYIARTGAGILLVVSLAACGSRAGAPATSTPPAAAPSLTAVATTPPTSMTPAPTATSAVPSSTAPPVTTSRPAQPTIPPASTPIASGQIVFAAIKPVPGSVNHRSAAIAFTVRAPVPITSLHVSLDGTVVTPEAGGRDQRHLSAFYQPPHWTAGRHTVVATAVAGRQTATHSWSFTID